MKKNLWFAALALAAMTSCSNDEVMDVAENRAIEFKSFVNNGSRADVVDVTKDGIRNFWVFGEYQNNQNWVDVFNNVHVSSEDGSKWTPEQIAYWEVDKPYNFGAYANGTSKLETGVSFASTATNAATLTFTNYSVGTGENDLVAAIANNKSWNGKAPTTPNKVELSFKHMLSKVKFTFTTKDSHDYIYKVSDLKITGESGALTQATGTYNVAGAASWGTTGQTGDYTYDEIGDYAQANGATSVSRYVIPQNNSNLTATFTVTAFDAAQNKLATAKFKANLKYSKGTVTATTDNEWTPGFVYNYTAEINYDKITEVDPDKPTAKPIEFSVSAVGGWSNANDTTTSPENNETAKSRP